MSDNIEFKCGICKKWGHSTARHLAWEEQQKRNTALAQAQVDKHRPKHADA